MRIGMMLDMYKPHISGVTNYVSLNRRALEAAGHEVSVFTFGEGTAPLEPNVYRTPGVPVAESGFYLGFRYTRAARLRLQEMDLVHVHHPFLSGGLALRYCRHRRIPIVFTNHTRYDLYAQVYLPMIPDPLSRTFLQAFMPGFCREVDLVVAPSEGIRRVLVELGVDSPIQVVPNGVDLTPFQQMADPAVRQRLGLRPDDVGLIYVGRIAAEKNLPFLLRTLAGVRAAAPDARLVLVGAGPELENLRGLARGLGLGEAVLFTGAVPYEEVPGILAAADAFVTASVSEVHPLSVIEAMATGLPVVGIDSPGVADIVRDGINGFLSSYDSAAFSAKLTRLVVDGPLRRHLGEAARRTAEDYSIDRTSALMQDHYLALVGQGARPRGGRWDAAWRQLFERLT